MSSPDRPRRSAAKAINYKAIFEDRDGIESSSSPSGSGSGSEGEEDGEEEAGGRKKDKGKGKAAEKRTSGRRKSAGRKRRQETSEEEDSGEDSAFELESAAADQDDEDDAMLVDEASSSGGGRRMSIDDEDDPDIIHVGPKKSRASINGPRGGGKAKKPRPSVRILASSGPGSKRPRNLDGPVTSSVNIEKSIPPSIVLDTRPGKRSRRHPLYLQPWGPLWFPPEYVALPERGFQAANDGAELQREGGRLPETARFNMVRLVTNMTVGIAPELVEDVGWWKGKWQESKSTEAMQDVETGERDKWGGWYDGLRAKLSDIRVLKTGAEKDPYLPKAMPRPRPLGEDGVVPPEAEFVEMNVGALDDEAPAQRKVRFERFSSHRLDSFIPGKPGHVLTPLGRPVSLSFLPGSDCLSSSSDFLSIVSISPSSDPGLGRPLPPGKQRKGGVQIWSGLVRKGECRRDLRGLKTESAKEKEKGLWRLELFLAMEVTPITAEWCPRGGKAAVDIAKGVKKDELPSLGVLGVSMSDGSICIYTVPEPSAARKAFGVAKDAPVFLMLKPRLRIDLQGVLCLSFAWGSHDLLACGLTNGHVALFDVAEAIEKGTSISRPRQYLEIHSGAIREVDWIRAPPVTPSMEPLPDGNPTHLITGGMDGSAFITDLRDVGSSILCCHLRGAVSGVSFSSVSGTPHVTDTDNRLRSISARPRDAKQLKRVAFSAGYTWATAHSDCHPFAATASIDGTCRITSTTRGWRFRSRVSTVVPKVYRLDFNRNTGELRMVDNILPEAQMSETTGGGRKNVSSSADPNVVNAADPSPAWPPIIAVTSVAWNPSIRRCAMLASGMACGLVRIDWLEGPSVVSWDRKEQFRTVEGQELKDEDDE